MMGVKASFWLMNNLIEELSRELGAGGVLTGLDVAARSCDPFVHLPPGSPALLRPRSTDDVARALSRCYEQGQSVVVHGGVTGVAGGASAGEEDLILSLERMNRILEIDPLNSTMIVEAGAPIEAVQMAAKQHGLFYPIDLGSKGSATVGGTIATNAGGHRVIRWGMTRQNVLGLEVVLADGTVLSVLNRFLKNNTGYDLKQLFIGSEGTLGVVCKAVLKLVPHPTTQQVALISVERYDQVLELLERARKLPQLSAFEVMWQDYYEVVSCEPARRLVDPSAAFFILIEGMGYQGETDDSAFAEMLEQAFEDGLLADAVIASSRKQMDDIWRVRESADILVREMSPFISFDISVDIRQADAFVADVRAALDDAFGAFRSVAFGHLGDSNIHIGVNIGADTLEHKVSIERCVYSVLLRYGGALTAEHGIGTAKRDFLPDHVAPAGLATMRQLRQALDPQRIINRQVLFGP